MIPVGSVYFGVYDASSGVLPPLPTQTGFWSISVAGTLNGTQYAVGTNLVYDTTVAAFYKEAGVNPEWNLIQNIPEAATRWAKYSDLTEVPDTIVNKDADGDIQVRMLRSAYPSQSAIPRGSSVAFRVNSGMDNFTRYGDVEALREFLGTVRDSEKLGGQTADKIKEDARSNLVPQSLTINKKRLEGPIEIDKYDVGLGNVPNYKETSSPAGTSTTLLATQRAAYEASAAPRLADERKRIIDISSSAPNSDANDGIYIVLDKVAKTFSIRLKSEGLWYTIS